MKNTLCIDATNGGECSLLGNVNDSTNRFFLEITSDLAKNPRLVIAGETLSITSNPFLYEIPSSLYTGSGTFAFNIADDNHTGDTFSVVKVASVDGNLILKQTSNFEYSLTVASKNICVLSNALTLERADETYTYDGSKQVTMQIDAPTDAQVNAWLDAHGVVTGATAEQAEQIRQNTTDITDLKSDLSLLNNNCIRGGKYLSGTPEAPYDNADTFPAGEVVTLAGAVVTNAPGQSGTMLTYQHGQTAQSGVVQIFVRNTGLTYVRIKWGTAWTEWQNFSAVQIDTSVTTSGKAADAGAVCRDAVMASGSVTDASIYTSVDDFPRNSIMMVSTTAITNRPGNRGNFTVVTLSPYKNTSLTASLQIAISNIGVPYMRIKWSSGWTAWVTLPSTYDEDIASVKSAATPYTSIALFQRIGVIGDSFASGEICVDGHYTDYYNRSWGQIMARRNGITCTNYSRGGLSTRTWLTDAKGLTLLNATTADDLYLIALGINDAGLGSDYVGTSADIGTDNDTFYGNYAKIINAVQSHAPDAKIVLLGMATPSSTTVKQAINNAINAIASHYGIPFIDQTQDDFFTSDFYLKNMVLGHPVGVVYAGMATAIERLLSQCMIDNLAYFKDFT